MSFQGESGLFWLNTPASTVLALAITILALSLLKALASIGVTIVTMSTLPSPAATALRASDFEMMLSNTIRTLGMRSLFQYLALGSITTSGERLSS